MNFYLYLSIFIAFIVVWFGMAHVNCKAASLRPNLLQIRFWWHRVVRTSSTCAQPVMHFFNSASLWENAGSWLNWGGAGEQPDRECPVLWRFSFACHSMGACDIASPGQVSSTQQGNICIENQFFSWTVKPVVDWTCSVHFQLWTNHDKASLLIN